jgi:DNA-binding transcriptional regulator YiaG
MIALREEDRKIPQRRHWEAFKRDSQGKKFMEPEEFVAEWAVGQAELARIAGCSVATVRAWFTKGRSHRPAKPYHKAQLAYYHQLWESLN